MYFTLAVCKTTNIKVAYYKGPCTVCNNSYFLSEHAYRFNFIHQQTKTIMKTIFLICVFITLQNIMLASSVQTAQQRRQLPCTHPLHLSAPELFTHCSSAPCTYGNWSSWERVIGNVTIVSQSLCPSGKAYTEECTRPTTGGGCDQPVRETQRTCNYTPILD